MERHNMETITRLRDERAALVERLQQIDKILRQFDELDRNARQLLKLTSEATIIDSSTVLTEPLTESLARSSLREVRKKTPMAEFQGAIIDVLRHNGTPMDRKALYEALMKRGVVIGDGDPDKEMNALSARVYRMKEDGILVSERGQGYQLKAGFLKSVEPADDDLKDLI
jgi:hypothetical protein